MKIIWIHPRISGAWIASLDELNGSFFDSCFGTDWYAYKRHEFSFWSYV